MVDGFDMTLLLVLQFVLGLLSLLAIGALVLHRWVRDGRDLPPGLRKVLSGFSRWAGVGIPERRRAFALSPSRRGRPDPSSATRCTRPAWEARRARWLT